MRRAIARLRCCTRHLARSGSRPQSRALGGDSKYGALLWLNRAFVARRSLSAGAHSLHVARHSLLRRGTQPPCHPTQPLRRGTQPLCHHDTATPSGHKAPPSPDTDAQSSSNAPLFRTKMPPQPNRLRSPSPAAPHRLRPLRAPPPHLSEIPLAPTSPTCSRPPMLPPNPAEIDETSSSNSR